MIEKDITSWEEFKAALTEEITEDTTYNIKNDLDASNDILTKNIECMGVGGAINKIFKGNGYKINAITAYGEVTIFHFDSIKMYFYRFYDIKFTNFMLDSGTFSNMGRPPIDPTNLFVNCFFNGVCRNFTPETIGQYAISFNKCSFNVRCEAFANDRSTFNSCYIITTPLQDTNFFSGSIVTDCYIEGTITSEPTTSTSSYITPNFEGNNVFNCKVIVKNYVDSRTYYLNPSGKAVLLNKNKLVQKDGITPIKNIADAENIYLLTDEQMKNKDYIQQNTKFPLYG